MVSQKLFKLVIQPMADSVPNWYTNIPFITHEKINPCYNGLTLTNV